LINWQNGSGLTTATEGIFTISICVYNMYKVECKKFV